MQMQWRSPKLSLGGHLCAPFTQMSIPLIYQLKTFGKGWPSALLSGGAQASNKERPDHRQGTDSANLVVR